MTVRIAVTRRLPAPIEQRLVQDFGARLRDDDAPLAADQLHALLAAHEVVIPTITDRLDAAALAAGKGTLRLLANFGAGINHVDLDAARALGIAVTNTPGVLTDDTADLTLLLLLAVARRAREGETEVRTGRWDGWRPTHLLGTRVTGATLGLVGFGRIGQAVARRAAAGFGMRVLCHGRRAVDPDVARACGATPVDTLDTLLSASDFVSLHCPATPGTRHLIGARELARMQPTAFLVNTARGDVVDEAALLQALERGTLAGAALDVFEREPAIPDLLRHHPRVYALPHLGSATVHSRVAMGERVLRNVEALLGGEALPDRVA